MPDLDRVATHYAREELIEAITAGLKELDVTPDTVGVDDLAPVDEFHTGGRTATESFLDQLGIGPTDHVLDVGCGLGGASRFAAERYGCRVTGIDLTREYIEAGTILCAWVGLTDRITLVQGDATATDFADGAFDKAYMLHVGMNIAHKASLASELYRLVKAGGKVGIFDIMRLGDEQPVFPLPWAGDAGGSALGSFDEYREALEDAGFVLLSQRNRRDFALDFFARVKAAAAHTKGPPALGIHLLMGEESAVKIPNMIKGIAANIIAPIELIARKPT